jgi:hypothetical protein
VVGGAVRESPLQVLINTGICWNEFVDVVGTSVLFLSE